MRAQKERAGRLHAEMCGRSARFFALVSGGWFEAVWFEAVWFEAGSRRAAVDSLRAALSSAIRVGDVMMARRASE